MSALKKLNAFKSELIRISNKHAPIHTRRLKCRNNPWMTKEILTLMYPRDHCKDKALKLKDAESWGNYKLFRNKVTKSV